MTIELKGITWNHSRGYLPKVATAQRFSELHPNVRITWEKRSLQAFADHPIEALIEQYDLLIIDHPWAGYAAASGALLPLNEHLSEAYLADQAANSVGASHRSYSFGGYQCALAVDAATPVASFRRDLLAEWGEAVPATWDELLQLARKGKVVVPGIPVDSLMHFYMMCIALGEEPFGQQDSCVSMETGVLALETYRELVSHCTREVFNWNPIQVYDAMADRDTFGYCPFAYGYSNYSRRGYARKLLEFTDLVDCGSLGKLGPAAEGLNTPHAAADQTNRLRSTLGGTGIAVSRMCKHPEEAIAYAAYMAAPEIQSSLYVDNGGQPGHRLAWQDAEANRTTANYFAQTLPALDRAFLRPRYDGYLYFQDHAGDPVRAYFRDGGNPRQVIDQINELYRHSLTIAKTKG